MRRSLTGQIRTSLQFIIGDDQEQFSAFDGTGEQSIGLFPPRRVKAVSNSFLCPHQVAELVPERDIRQSFIVGQGFQATFDIVDGLFAFGDDIHVGIVEAGGLEFVDPGAGPRPDY